MNCESYTLKNPQCNSVYKAERTDMQREAGRSTLTRKALKWPLAWHRLADKIYKRFKWHQQDRPHKYNFITLTWKNILV
jgi:hypothetical protein